MAHQQLAVRASELGPAQFVKYRGDLVLVALVAVGPSLFIGVKCSQELESGADSVLPRNDVDGTDENAN